MARLCHFQRGRKRRRVMVAGWGGGIRCNVNWVHLSMHVRNDGDLTFLVLILPINWIKLTYSLPFVHWCHILHYTFVWINIIYTAKGCMEKLDFSLLQQINDSFLWWSFQEKGPRIVEIFSRVLRDSTPRFVRRSVGRSVGHTLLFLSVLFLLTHFK